MKRLYSSVRWSLGIVLLMLSPIVLIFALPAAIGIGLDVFEHAGEAPVALALCLPIILVLAARAFARAPARRAIAALLASRLHLHRPARQH